MVGDEGRLRQVFANLLSNALTHTPPGTPVAVLVRSDDGWAEIEVSDRGPGLAADEAAHVFEPFYRADPARGRVHDADRMSSRAPGSGSPSSPRSPRHTAATSRVVSQPADGATFIVRIPVEGAAQLEDATPPMPVDVDGQA